MIYSYRVESTFGRNSLYSDNLYLKTINNLVTLRFFLNTFILIK